MALIHPFYRAFAYTFAELFITLLVLGSLAAFTIPKLLSPVDTNERKVVMRQALAVIRQATLQARQEGAYNAIRRDYYLDKFASVKYCPYAVASEGCATSDMVFAGESGWVFPSGAVFYGLNSTTFEGASDGRMVPRL